MATPADLPTDGRIQRSERSREAIVQALVDLVGEGALSPTAQEVAARADVGVRTVFRHFSDMETLFAAMNARLTEELDSLFVAEEQTGPFAARVDAMIDRRLEIMDRISPYLRASAQKRRRSAFLREQGDRNVRMLRRDMKRWLPELDSAPPDITDSLELILSFEAYDRLRSEQRLSARRADAAIRHLVHLLTDSLDASD